MKRLVLAMAALTLITGCGIRGDLERPDPLWNRDEAIRQECQRQAENNERQDPRCVRYEGGANP